MSMTVTITGTLGADPELKFGPTGVAIMNARVVTSRKHKDDKTGEWKDLDTSWWHVTAWRQLAENAAETLRKGDEVIIVGKLKQRQYETAQGEKRTVSEVTADWIGPNLKKVSGNLNRVKRAAASGEGRAAYDAAKQQIEDPWTTELAEGEVPF
jgi:single-strand DNA-binding protein